MKKELLILAAMSFIICTAVGQMAWSDNKIKDMRMMGGIENADNVYVVPYQDSMMGDGDQNRYRETNQWYGSMMAGRDQGKLEMKQDQKSIALCACECKKMMMDKYGNEAGKMNECSYPMRNMDDWGNKDQMDHGQKSMMSWKGVGQDDKNPMIICVCACQEQ